LQFFQDIAENLERITRHTAGYGAQRFLDDEKCQDAVLHCLLWISEAARVLGDRAGRVAPSVPWRDVRGIGNRLRHEYQKVDLRLIWRIVEKDLPSLRQPFEPRSSL
jgi:uncharacterized protein with HEPN domain